MPSIESLPPELLHEIVKWVDDPHDNRYRFLQNGDLANLRRTCRKLSNAAAVSLFHTVRIFR